MYENNCCLNQTTVSPLEDKTVISFASLDSLKCFDISRTYASMKLSFFDIGIWLLLPCFNFFLFYQIGKTSFSKKCEDTLDKLLVESLQELQKEEECEVKQTQSCIPSVSQATSGEPNVAFYETFEFEKWRAERLAPMDMEMVLSTYVRDSQTGVIKLSSRQCESYNEHLIVDDLDACFAVAYVGNTNVSYAIARIDSNIDHYGVSISRPDPSQIDKYSERYALNKHNEGLRFPTGFFRKVPKENGRLRTKDKLGTFLEHFEDIEQQFDAKLKKHNIQKGDDLVVMVTNEGEIDLFLNFACSCRLHDISMNNVLVFAGSSEIVSIVEATGAMGLYHEGYASVSKKASQDYLDRVFVDMMWYKAFSIFLVLRKGINVLFQDVDLVWFRDPMPYFHEYRRQAHNRSLETGAFVEAFFSDDGQRSMRYTPFYANSGFYYLVASERSTYFAWSIMAAMDAIQVLGSHQNVLTTKLVEGLALSQQHTKILTLEEFPTGIMYHHNRAYMKQMREKKVAPYGFHMCWTQGKPQKLVYLRKALMWYLKEECSPLEALMYDTRERHFWGHGTPVNGIIYQYVDQNLRNLPSGVQWDKLAERCCTMMRGAP